MRDWCSESPASRPPDRRTGQGTDSRFSQLFSKWGQYGKRSVVGRVTFAAASYVCRTGWNGSLLVYETAKAVRSSNKVMSLTTSAMTRRDIRLIDRITLSTVANVIKPVRDSLLYHLDPVAVQR